MQVKTIEGLRAPVREAVRIAAIAAAGAATALALHVGFNGGSPQAPEAKAPIVQLDARTPSYAWQGRSIGLEFAGDLSSPSGRLATMGVSQGDIEQAEWQIINRGRLRAGAGAYDMSLDAGAERDQVASRLMSNPSVAQKAVGFAAAHVIAANLEFSKMINAHLTNPTAETKAFFNEPGAFRHDPTKVENLAARDLVLGAAVMDRILEKARETARITGDAALVSSIEQNAGLGAFSKTLHESVANGSVAGFSRAPIAPTAENVTAITQLAAREIPAEIELRGYRNEAGTLTPVGVKIDLERATHAMTLPRDRSAEIAERLQDIKFLAGISHR